MNEDTQALVFLSYGPEDQPLARQIASDLQQEGLRVSTDEWDASFDESASRRYDRARNKADLLAVLLSEHSLTSQPLKSRWGGGKTAARSSDNEVLLLKSDNVQIPQFLLNRSRIDFGRDYKGAFSELVARVGPKLTEGYSVFPSTQTTEVADVQEQGARAQAALESLCGKYWHPLYVFLRGRNHSVEDAQDITQGFFENFLKGPAFGNYDRSRGRLRSYLLGALIHFESKWRRKKETHKAGGKYKFQSWDWLEAERQYQAEPDDVDSPDVLFDRRWAITMLEQVEVALREDYVGRGKRQLFELVHAHINGNLQQSLADAAASLNMSPEAFKMSGTRMRNKARVILRSQIAQTVTSPDLVDSEIVYLLSLFEKNPPVDPNV